MISALALSAAMFLLGALPPENSVDTRTENSLGTRTENSLNTRRVEGYRIDHRAVRGRVHHAIGFSIAFPNTRHVEGYPVQAPEITHIDSPWGPHPLRLALQPTAAETPRICPKHRWEYPYLTELRTPEGALRFRIYHQSVRSASMARDAGRMLARLWQLSMAKMRLDHPLSHRSIVDVFLADGGTPGGEQGIFHGPENISYNTIYIYDLRSFTSPVGMAREIAHEYGHAVIPAIGGFSEPEEWGDGYLGENLFLTWLSRETSLTPEDRMGATREQLSEWVKTNSRPLADRTWTRGPDTRALAGKGKPAMDEYIGILLYMSEAFPAGLHRAIRLTGGMTAPDALNGVFEAVNELDAWDVRVPNHVVGKDIWLPLRGRWQVTGGSVVPTPGVFKVKASLEKISLRRQQ